MKGVTKKMRNLFKNKGVAVVMITALFLSGSSALKPTRLFAAEKAQLQVEAKSAKAVNVNQAGADELMTVKGIGPVIAKRILDYRTQHGRFEKLEDLRNVQGIGEAKFEKIRGQVAV